MAHQIVMVMRHAEKPNADIAVGGVSLSGRPDPNELSVRGWQRAGALVSFFGPLSHPVPRSVYRPSALFAPRPTPLAPSGRGRSTLMPLSDALGVPISLEFEKGQEMQLAEAVLRHDGPALVVWQHQALMDFARHLVGNAVSLPMAWPEKRFDMMWLFERNGGPWRFTQVAQLLLAGDSPDPIA